MHSASSWVAGKSYDGIRVAQLFFDRVWTELRWISRDDELLNSFQQSSHRHEASLIDCLLAELDIMRDVHYQEKLCGYRRIVIEQAITAFTGAFTLKSIAKLLVFGSTTSRLSDIDKKVLPDVENYESMLFLVFDSIDCRLTSE